MKAHFICFILFFICLFPIPGQAQEEKHHLILISIDGLRPEFYLDERWPSPVIQWMAKEGAYAAGVTGIFPSVTYPSHTSMVSGVLPNKHGIYYNSPFEEGGQTGRWYWEYDGIKVETIFSAARKKGLQSGAISWPVSVGAPIDYNLPEIWSLDPKEDPFAPIRKYATPSGFVEEIEKKAMGPMNKRTYGNEGYLAREHRFSAAASYIFEEYAPDILAVHLIAADHFQHRDGREGFMPKRSMGTVDAAISQLLEAIERSGKLEQCTFIVTGDHGFIDLHTLLCPNVWLVEAGLMENKKDRGNWKASFHTSGASAFLQLKDPKDKKSLEKVKEILDKQPMATKKLFRVLDQEEIKAAGADPNAVLALAPAEGVNLSASSDGPAIKAATGGTHGFFPDSKNIQTGFIAFGKGIRKGVVIPEMNLIDIAPLISTLLGFDMKDMDGMLYPGILED